MKFSFAALTKRLRGAGYGSALRPERDWLVLLSFVFLLIVASVAWNSWMFSRAINGEAIGTEPLPVPGSVNLDSVTKTFEERAAEEARYRNEYRFIDPSAQPR